VLVSHEFKLSNIWPLCATWSLLLHGRPVAERVRIIDGPDRWSEAQSRTSPARGWEIRIL